jgi:mono/diheme cytochrome c family protein
MKVADLARRPVMPREVSDITRPLVGLALILSAGVAAVSPASAADTARGGQLAQRWCVSCHVIGDTSSGTVPQGPPSFRSIARGGRTADQLRGLLSHPHGEMPDLALSRSEIDDLIGYIGTLR